MKTLRGVGRRFAMRGPGLQTTREGFARIADRVIDGIAPRVRAGNVSDRVVIGACLVLVKRTGEKDCAQGSSVRSAWSDGKRAEVPCPVDSRRL